MKTIKINFVDFSKDFDKENNNFINLLRERYNVQISESPDYIFFSIFGKKFLDYDCVKIFYTGECIVPNFDLCDYAIGFDNILFGDRYIRVPLYQLFNYRTKFLSIVNNDIPLLHKTEFCSFVVSNDQGMKERATMIELLSKYKKVDSGGRYRNNVGGPVKDKFAFDQTHKFSICFENCMQKGYTTEKIVEAFAAGCIPIYYGNPDIGEEFNTKAFINVHDFDNLEDVANKVVEIDQNEALYKQIKSEPIITGAQKDENELRSFLYAIFEQPLELARRRPYNTRIYELESNYSLIRMYERLIGKHQKKVKAFFRRLKNGAI